MFNVNVNVFLEKHYSRKADIIYGSLEEGEEVP